MSPQPTALDVFSGCGGMTLGLKQAGFRVLGAVDNDPLAISTYRSNHPEVLLWETDIRELSVTKVRKDLNLRSSRPDLIAGCPPCQGFSSIRTLNGGRVVKDPRNGLIRDFLRFVRSLKPAVVMLENVPAIAGDPGYLKFKKELEKTGYHCIETVVNAADFGVPQRRRRFVFLAGLSCEVAFPQPVHPQKTVRSAIGDLAPPGKGIDLLHDYSERRSTRIAELISDIPADGGSRQALGTERQLACHKKCDGFKDIYGRMKWDDVAPTITSGCTNPSKGRFLHPDQNRAITLREAALLQSFPLDYTFSLERGRGGAARLIGNALPPEFVKRQARVLYELISRAKGENTREGDEQHVAG